jgi:hypothetical protein
LIIRNSGLRPRLLMISGYGSMAMQPSLQVALFIEVGPKREGSTFAVSGLRILSSGVMALGNASLRTLQALRRSSLSAGCIWAYQLIRVSLA